MHLTEAFHLSTDSVDKEQLLNPNLLLLLNLGDLITG
jgi:hypothetical protein